MLYEGDRNNARRRARRDCRHGKNNPAKNRQRPLAERLSALAQTHQGDEKGLRWRCWMIARPYGSRPRRRAARSGRKRLKGAKCAETLSAQMDAMLATLADFVSTHVLYIANPTDAEKVTMVAVAAMAAAVWRRIPTSIYCFSCPKRNATSESFVEYILYMLWDLGLKVGHATRTVNECVTQAQADMTVRTAMLESRFLWGSAPLFEAYKEAFQNKVMQGTARQFVTANGRTR